MNEFFNELPWHDAVLEFVIIDRSRPGENDVIKISIDWPLEGYSKQIEFRECYGLDMNMNFGIIASESILTAECLVKSETLNKICNHWGRVGVDLSELKHYRIITNSTNSNINIYAKYFCML